MSKSSTFGRFCEAVKPVDFDERSNQVALLDILRQICKEEPDIKHTLITHAANLAGKTASVLLVSIVSNSVQVVTVKSKSMVFSTAVTVQQCYKKHFPHLKANLWVMQQGKLIPLPSTRESYPNESFDTYTLHDVLELFRKEKNTSVCVLFSTPRNATNQLGQSNIPHERMWLWMDEVHTACDQPGNEHRLNDFRVVLVGSASMEQEHVENYLQRCGRTSPKWVGERETSTANSRLRVDWKDAFPPVDFAVAGSLPKYDPKTWGSILKSKYGALFEGWAKASDLNVVEKAEKGIIGTNECNIVICQRKTVLATASALELEYGDRVLIVQESGLAATFLRDKINAERTGQYGGKSIVAVITENFVVGTNWHGLTGILVLHPTITLPEEPTVGQAPETAKQEFLLDLMSKGVVQVVHRGRCDKTPINFCMTTPFVPKKHGDMRITQDELITEFRRTFGEVQNCTVHEYKPEQLFFEPKVSVYDWGSDSDSDDSDSDDID